MTTRMAQLVVVAIVLCQWGCPTQYDYPAVPAETAGDDQLGSETVDGLVADGAMQIDVQDLVGDPRPVDVPGSPELIDAAELPDVPDLKDTAADLPGDDAGDLLDLVQDETMPDADEADEVAPACTADGDCDDENPCTDDKCVAGECENANNEAQCEDGLDCTADDQCVDGKCEPGEISADCLIDCGDGYCIAPETANLCADDCGFCGDGVCGVNETSGKIVFCPADCEVPCGDGICAEAVETSDSCIVDCPICGDGLCGLGEDWENCDADCDPPCGDGICQLGESLATCYVDCLPPCGDGICQSGENPSVCPADCIICGDGVCGKEETQESCPMDCMAPCGNGICEGGENPENCAVDCGWCGDGVCGFVEDSDVCPLDCLGGCGDGECADGETAVGCPVDCVDDADEDGVADDEDNCPYKPNADQFDNDKDDVGDLCDNDDDNDTELDTTDCAPFDSAISHLAKEICNGVNDDCDDDTDEDSCDDDDPCTVDEECIDSACYSSPKCDDGNVCTNDTCKAESGECKHAANSEFCDDNDACTTGDSCVQAACVGVGVLDCSDGNDCTEDTCESDSGCLDPEPLTGTDCSDGSLCTTEDKCEQGVCVGAATECDDDNVCTDDSCDEIDGQCINFPNELACDDLDPCTKDDMCGAGTCQGVPDDCDDGNQCTENWCQEGVGCQTANVEDGTGCDDGEECWVGDTCQSAVCESGVELNLCDDDNDCTADSCKPKIGCQNDAVDDGLGCDDKDACTPTDSCQGGVCLGQGDVDCDDQVLCTDDSCVAETGCEYGFVDVCVADDLDWDLDGIANTEDKCHFAHDVGNPDANDISGTDACEKLAAHEGDFLLTRELIVDVWGETSDVRRTNEPVDLLIRNSWFGDVVAASLDMVDGEVVDRAGHEWDMEVVGIQPVKGVFGDTEGAMDFTPKPARVVIKSAEALQPGEGPFTVMTWFKTGPNPTDEMSLFGNSNQYYYYDWDWTGINVRFGRGCNKVWQWGEWKKVIDGKFGFLYVSLGDDEKCDSVETSVPLADQQWHHMAAVYSTDANLKLYVDGELVDQQGATAPFTVDEYAVVGGSLTKYYNQNTKEYNYSWGPQFNGFMDDFVFLKRALTQEEILAYYHSDSPYGSNSFELPGSNYTGIRLTETPGLGELGEEAVKRYELWARRNHSAAPCPEAADPATFPDRDDMCGVTAMWPLDASGAATSPEFGDALDAVASNGWYIEPGPDLTGNKWGAVRFAEDGFGSPLSVENHQALDWGWDKDFTLEFRFRIAALPADDSVVLLAREKKKWSNNQWVFDMGHRVTLGGGAALSWYTSSVILSAPDNKYDVMDGVWHHVAFRAQHTEKKYQKTKFQLYLDGEKVGEIAVDPPYYLSDASGNPLVIGSANTEGHDVYVDDVVLHNVAKSPEYLQRRGYQGPPKIRFLANTVIDNQGTEQSPEYPARTYTLHLSDEADEMPWAKLPTTGSGIANCSGESGSCMSVSFDLGDPQGCLADCYGKQCGGDGCGGDCGECLEGFQCNADHSACIPDEGWVLVEPDTFFLGTSGNKACGGAPGNQVTISHTLLAKAHEITQSEWVEVTGGENPAYFQDGAGGACFDGEPGDCPMENISWYGAAYYCNELSKKEGLPECYLMSPACEFGEPGTNPDCGWVGFVGLDCPGYRLPTEAEWEFLARAGVNKDFHFPLPDGSDLENCPQCMDNQLTYLDHLWYCGNAFQKTHAVGQRTPNKWGLYDMLGNVAEWTNDTDDTGQGWYDGEVWLNAVDPHIWSGEEGPRRVRGGSYQSKVWECQTHYRGENGVNAGDTEKYIGARVVRTLK